MTEATGSAAATGGTAGSPAATTGAAAAPNGSGTGGAADPFAGLETGSREWVGKSGVKDVATLVKNAMNAEGLIGKSIQLPGDDAKPEDWDKVYNRLGRPEKADSYEFKLPDGVPAEMPYDGEMAKAFKPAAHQLGLTAKQAAGVHDFLVGYTGKGFSAQGEAAAARATAATEALETKWGKSDSDGFKAKIDATLRTLKGSELEAEFKAAGLLGDLNGKTFVTNAKIAMFLADVGDKLFREDGFVGGNGGGGTADNVFTPGPEKGNMTEQNKAIKDDRANAIRQIRAAGRKPSEWGLPDQ